MSEENNDSKKSEKINIVSVKCERDELMGSGAPRASIVHHHTPLTIRTKCEDDISDADSTPPQATKDDYDFMKTPEYVPNYTIKDEHLCSEMPTPESEIGIEDSADGNNEITERNINNDVPELDPKNNSDNNVDETTPDDSTGIRPNSGVQNYEEVPDDFFGDSFFSSYQVKNEPSPNPEQVSNAKITDQTNKNVTQTNKTNKNSESTGGRIIKLEPSNNPDNGSTEINPNSAEQNYEEIPDDFFGDFAYCPTYQVKNEPSASVVPNLERVRNDDDEAVQAAITDENNKYASPNISSNDARTNFGNVDFYRRNNLEIDSVPNVESSNDNFYGAFPIKSEIEPVNTQYHTGAKNNAPPRSDHVTNDNSSKDSETHDNDLEMIRLRFLEKLEQLSEDDELPCSSRSLKKRKKKHRRHSQDSGDGEYKRNKKSKHDKHGSKRHDRSRSKSRDDSVNDRQQSRDKHSHKSHRHKRDPERRSWSLSPDRSLTKRRREHQTPNIIQVKLEHDFPSNEMEIMLRPEEKQHVTNPPKLKLINFNNLMHQGSPPPASLSETLEEKIKKSLHHAIKQLKAISSHESSSSNFIFTPTMTTAKNNRSILSQINMNPSPLSSNKEFIFSQTSTGATVNLSDYGLQQPPELSQHLMRLLGRDIKHLEEMRRSLKLPPKISTMIDIANSVKTETKQYQSMLYRDTDTQTDERFFKKRTSNFSTQYCDNDLLDMKDNTDKQKYALLLMQETFNTPVYSASEEIQQNMRIYEAVKIANRKYRSN